MSYKVLILCCDYSPWEAPSYFYYIGDAWNKLVEGSGVFNIDHLPQILQIKKIYRKSRKYLIC